MKTTLEIPDSVFRKAKSVAARRGIALREFVTEAVREKLSNGPDGSGKPWLQLMGKLKHLRKETKHINKRIREHSETIDREIWS